MINAKTYNVRETLKNGMSVTVRAIMADDKGTILESFKGLDDETLYSRFFAPKKDLSEQELKQLTEVDFEQTVALVITPQAEGREKIIGGGRYISFKDAEGIDSAEFAMIVEEDYQGLGLGKLILKHLITIARARGINKFEAEVLPANERMLNLLRKTGLPMSMVNRDESVYVSIDLKTVDRS
jgi:RimJ/RimL family protein N-acetyltransferase